MTLLAWCVAFLLDRLLGDPPHWPHPVRWIGALINLVQSVVAECVAAIPRCASAAG